MAPTSRARRAELDGVAS